MLKSSEVLKNRKELLEKRSVQHIAKVNEEMLAIEKSINKYNKDIDDTKDYIDIDMIITTEESKQALKEAEWVIDKSQSVPCGHTWIRPVEEDCSFNRMDKEHVKDMNKLEHNKKEENNINVNEDELINILNDIFCKNVRFS